jgi:hypothetical protein
MLFWVLAAWVLVALVGAVVWQHLVAAGCWLAG